MVSETEKLKASLRNWGSGDGERAPEFIREAATLSEWNAAPESLDGVQRGNL